MDYPTPNSPNPIQHITSQQLVDLIAREPTLQVLDVRTLPEYVQLGHIHDAILLPVQELADRWQELDSEKAIAVICQHGVRSAYAADFLNQKGFQKVYNHQDGMVAWVGDLSFDWPSSVC